MSMMRHCFRANSYNTAPQLFARDRANSAELFAQVHLPCEQQLPILIDEGWTLIDVTIDYGNLRTLSLTLKLWMLHSLPQSYLQQEEWLMKPVLFCKRLASLLCDKWSETYAYVMGWLRCYLSFSLLHLVISCVRGSCSSFESLSTCLGQLC